MVISDKSVRRIAKTELGVTRYKKFSFSLKKCKLVRLRRCRKLLKRAAGQRWEIFIFTDEKFFTVEQFHNSQNDKIWSADASSTATVENRQHPKSVMVWGRICSRGKTPLVLVGVKINQKVYQRDIL
ncbi:uncharacterized protein TNCV_3703451 [Trichonephila clavipes]|nr:uncharacterized protein TNCV_3703451 [Trichonephila clavipes]